MTNESESGKRETLADIVAEMRREVGDGKDTYCGKRVIRRMEDARVMQFCDRIEAAWKRELAAFDCECAGIAGLAAKEEAARHKPGNAAALREALDELVANIEMRASAFGIFSIIDRKTFLDAKAALSEPARNCDRFADETDAQIAFLNEVWLISVTKETTLEQDKIENWTDEMRIAYAKWLLAPAAERKGEGK